MGGMASAVRAIHDAKKPFHLSEMAGWMANSVRRARVGTARNELAALTAINPPRPLWPRRTPSPPPRTTAVRTTATESVSWCQNRIGIPWEPVQLADVVNQSNTWPRNDIRRGLRTAECEPRERRSARDRPGGDQPPRPA